MPPIIIEKLEKFDSTITAVENEQEEESSRNV